jgi:hypothetical protein
MVCVEAYQVEHQTTAYVADALAWIAISVVVISKQKRCRIEEHLGSLARGRPT